MSRRGGGVGSGGGGGRERRGWSGGVRLSVVGVLWCGVVCVVVMSAMMGMTMRTAPRWRLSMETGARAEAGSGLPEADKSEGVVPR